MNGATRHVPADVDVARDDRTPEIRRARAGSGVTSRLILFYLEREGGRPAVEEALELTGLRGLEDQLRDEGYWFSFETKMSLWGAVEKITSNPRIAEEVGRSALEFNVAPTLKRALRALGSPELVFRNVSRANGKFNWAHTLDVVAMNPQRVRLRYTDVSGSGYHRYDCEYTTGLLATIPQLFGLAPAHVAHPACGARGDAACVFDVTWTEGAQGIKRAAFGLGALAATLALGGVALDPALLVASGGVALSAAMGLGLQTRAYVRRRIGGLQARVQEQDAAIAQLFESLGDLSADLRLDEVLEKITSKAQTAVGGKEFALLLSDGSGLRANRHSGIAADTLTELEAWAASQHGAIRRGPLVVDDVASIPALAHLAQDPRLPLGSMCAAPMIFRERFLGVLIALAYGSRVFLPHESAALAAYAAQGAIALSNAHLVAGLERQAEEDALTGLANTRGFERACAIAFPGPGGGGAPVSIVALDLDHFKAINDTFGHPYGDDVLRQVAQRLRAIVRPSDTVARLGGEEFALLLPGTSSSSAERIAERARAAIAAVEVSGLSLTSSAGVASYPGIACPDLLRLADRALYRAKYDGRDRTAVWEPDPGQTDAAARGEAGVGSDGAEDRRAAAPGP